MTSFIADSIDDKGFVPIPTRRCENNYNVFMTRSSVTEHTCGLQTEPGDKCIILFSLNRRLAKIFQFPTTSRLFRKRFARKIPKQTSKRRKPLTRRIQKTLHQRITRSTAWLEARMLMQKFKSPTILPFPRDEVDENEDRMNKDGKKGEKTSVPTKQ